jgi:hypothetical protein
VKYYKPKEKQEKTDEQRARRRQLFFDKRVKSVLECDECGMPITQAEYKRNQGLCNTCSNETN